MSEVDRYELLSLLRIYVREYPLMAEDAQPIIEELEDSLPGSETA